MLSAMKESTRGLEVDSESVHLRLTGPGKWRLRDLWKIKAE